MDQRLSLVGGDAHGRARTAGWPQAALYGLILRIALVPFESRAISRSKGLAHLLA